MIPEKTNSLLCLSWNSLSCFPQTFMVVYTTTSLSCALSKQKTVLYIFISIFCFSTFYYCKMYVIQNLPFWPFLNVRFSGTHRLQQHVSPELFHQLRLKVHIITRQWFFILPLPQPLAPLTLLSVPVNVPVLGVSYGTMQHLSFWVWLVSLSVTFSGFNRVRAFLLLWRLNNAPLFIVHHILFVHRFIDGHLGCFHLSVIVNNAAITADV